MPARHSGYVQAIDGAALMSLAEKHDLCLEVRHRPGKFVFAGHPLLEIHRTRAVEDGVVEALARAFIIGRHRTPEQDVEFAIDQMVEIAVRALSPGVNDPFTRVGLRQLARRSALPDCAAGVAVAVPLRPMWRAAGHRPRVGHRRYHRPRRSIRSVTTGERAPR